MNKKVPCGRHAAGDFNWDKIIRFSVKMGQKEPSPVTHVKMGQKEPSPVTHLDLEGSGRGSEGGEGCRCVLEIENFGVVVLGGIHAL